MTRREAAEYLRISVASVDRRMTPAKDGFVAGQFRFVTMDWNSSHSPIRIMREDVVRLLPNVEAA